MSRRTAVQWRHRAIYAHAQRAVPLPPSLPESRPGRRIIGEFIARYNTELSFFVVGVADLVLPEVPPARCFGEVILGGFVGFVLRHLTKFFEVGGGDSELSATPGRRP